MIKNILKLEGVQKLGKNEQKNVKGGRRNISIERQCSSCEILLNNVCVQVCL